MDTTLVLLILAGLAASWLLSLLFGRKLIPVLRALKAGQSIREIGPSWHNTKAGTPIMGGIMFIASAGLCSVALGFALPALGLAQKSYTHLFVLLFSLAFGLIGFTDDFVKVKKKRNLGLTALQKLALQIAVAAVYLLLLRSTGDLSCTLWIPFTDVTLEMNHTLYIVFAALVIVGCVNAVNLTDGVDGLSSSVTIPVMLFFAAMSLLRGRGVLAALPAALAGGLLGYLHYNRYPAQVFMGDTGSLFLGGAVCGLAFALDMPLILILVGFVYIMETLSVILQVTYFKLTHGKRIFKMTPIHHHFELCGWSEKKIVAVFTSVSAAMCLIALLGNL